MRQIDLIIHNPVGLHARPAKNFVNAAKQFESKIRVRHGAKEGDAKSLISVLTLGVESGGRIKITFEGPDEDAALDVLKALVSNGLGDDTQPKNMEAVPQVGNETTTAGPRTLHGLPASPGLAIGPLYQYRQSPVEPEVVASDSGEERRRLQAALTAARKELESLRVEVLDRLGASEAAIFEAHSELLDDPAILEAVEAEIEAGHSATQAWQIAIETQRTLVADLNNELLAARESDIRDVGKRVFRLLYGHEAAALKLPSTPVILVADDLTPSDTVTLDRTLVLGFCTVGGGPTSHTAILARALRLPAIVGAEPRILESPSGVTAILDGGSGVLTIQPDSTEIAVARKSIEQRRLRDAADMRASIGPAITRDEHRVEVVANIANVHDAEQAVAFGAEGVGLLRTEFLFLNRAKAPTEDEQFEVYREIAEALSGRPVIVRTLDIGGDKGVPYLPLPVEENPSLGQRGIRLCLAHPELMKTQVRAVLRAAAYGSLKIMFPMVSQLEEWRAARKVVEEARSELEAPPIELGIMVEVPAAALLAEIFAQEVDFFSIGTNDLTQYVLAVDRVHATLAADADALHPAVLHLIRHTVRAAHGAGKLVAVCGELAADPHASPILVGLGVDELSVNVTAIPALKSRIRSMTFSSAQELAEQALACATASEVRERVASQ